jgi:transposase
VLKTSPNIVHEKMVSAPQLKPQHHATRATFADAHQTWTKQWNYVIWSDEKKFNLDGPDGLSYYWRDLRKEPRFFSRRNFGGGSLMVWGGFCADTKLPLQVISTRINSVAYQGVLQDNLLPFLQHHHATRYIFQQDNAAVHSSASTREWLRARNIEVLDWPAKSPDLNPIENLWGVLVREVYKDCRQYDSVAELEKAVKLAWSRIPVQLMKKLVYSMPQRINEVIKNHGKPTSY